MEPAKEKYLSIITNFGCHFECPYCITKTTGINVPKTTVEGLDGLEEAVKQTGATIISISGGGDPLYEYEENYDWWNQLFDIANKLDIPLELHTSYKGMHGVYPYFHRVVYHCQKVEDLFKIERSWEEKTRVVFVVTSDFNAMTIGDIHAIVKHHPDIDELSFRQMVDENYKPTTYCQHFLRQFHKKFWYYIEQDDYNTYYVNGKIYHKFADIGKEI